MTDQRKALSGNDIFGAPRMRPEWVDVPEWGGGVYVRPLMAGELDELQATLGGREEGDHSYRARIVALCACDADGNALFTEADAPRIAQLDALPVARVAMAAHRLNGVGVIASEAAEKN